MKTHEKTEKMLEYAVHDSLSEGSRVLHDVVAEVYRQVGGFWFKTTEEPLQSAVDRCLRDRISVGKTIVDFDEFGRAVFSNSTNYNGDN